MAELDLLKFRTRVEQAWSPESAFKHDPNRDPAWGQCAVTALLVHDTFGGSIVKATVVGPGFRVGHYWNVLADLTDRPVDFDLTWRQFPVGSKIVGKIEDVNPKTLVRSIRGRYAILKSNFEILA